MVTRRTDATNDADSLILIGAAAVLAVVGTGGLWVCVHLAALVDGGRAPSRNPVQLVVELVTGRQPWTVTTTIVTVVMVLVLLVATFLLIAHWPKPKHRKMRPDRAARYMAAPAELKHLTRAGAAAKATRLECAPVAVEAAGVPFGVTVRARLELFASWEDMLIMIAGPRTQKSTAYAIPAILAAPGAVLATSNKRDVKDATIELRRELGRVHVFDPQGVANTHQTMWWNPLSYVDGSETRAEKLAVQLAASARPEGAKRDAYFDPAAEELISLLLLAADLAKRPITTVYTWLARPASVEAADILTEHGYELQHEAMWSYAHLADKQRDGVYGTARSLMGFLRNRQIVSWVTPGRGPQFSPHDYARSTDTLYLLSAEGEGSVGPLVAALTLAVLEALEAHATDSPGGRLAVPFLGVLDEAANICKLRNLDTKYSHYGSRGLILFTILQSWAQGCDVWGDRGMAKLWSSANIKLYGGGVDDEPFLGRLERLIGTADVVTRSQSVHKGARTVSRSITKESILTTAELRELPQGRAVAFPSGTPAVLVEPQPYYNGPAAAAVAASIAENSDTVEV